MKCHYNKYVSITKETGENKEFWHILKLVSENREPLHTMLGTALRVSTSARRGRGRGYAQLIEAWAVFFNRSEQDIEEMGKVI
jgi:hypothetical protein